MDDAYRLAARAVRRALWRWWLRVGIWWAALAVGLIVVDLWSIVGRWRWFSSGSAMLGGLVPIELAWTSAAGSLVIPMVTLLWLLLALKTAALVTQLAEPAGQIPLRATALIRFQAIAAHSWIALVLLAVHHSVGGLLFQIGVLDGRPPGLLVASRGVEGLTDLLPVAVELLLLAALIALRGPAVLAVAWWLVRLAGAPLCGFAWFIAGRVALSTSQNLHQAVQRMEYWPGRFSWPELPGLAVAILLGAGLALVYIALALLAAGKRRPGIALLTATLMISAVGLPTLNIGSTAVDFVRAAAAQLLSFQDLLGSSYDYSWFSGGPGVQVGYRVQQLETWVVGFKSTRFWPVELAALALVPPTVHVTAHFLALRWLLLRAGGPPG